MFNLGRRIRKIFYGDGNTVCVDSGKSPLDRNSDAIKEEPADDWKPGEPVENMVRAYIKNRRRFKIEECRTYGSTGSRTFTITDRKNGEVYIFMSNRLYSNIWHVRPDWMTPEEAEWGYKRIQESNSGRLSRLVEIKKIRRERVLMSERNRIINLYKED